MKNVQITGELFINLVKYFLPDQGEEEHNKELEVIIKDELQDKVDRMARHFDYTDKVKRRESSSLY